MHAFMKYTDCWLTIKMLPPPPPARRHRQLTAEFFNLFSEAEPFKSGGGVLGEVAASPLPTSYRVWGSAVSPTANTFWTY